MQVRAQLAAIGLPLLGDSMYVPMAGLTVDGSGVAGEDILAAVSQVV
jgi:23S rRNA-/tRNA-specific pseudouridylate synthase